MKNPENIQRHRHTGKILSFSECLYAAHVGTLCRHSSRILHGMIRILFHKESVKIYTPFSTQTNVWNG